MSNTVAQEWGEPQTAYAVIRRLHTFDSLDKGTIAKDPLIAMQRADAYDRKAEYLVRQHRLVQIALYQHGSNVRIKLLKTVCSLIGHKPEWVTDQLSAWGIDDPYNTQTEVQ